MKNRKENLGVESMVQAIVLAAGIGTRLSPLTSVTPKALLPIANMPLIDYVIDSILSVGFKEIIVVTGYMGSKILKHLEASRKDGTIEIKCVKANRYKEGPLYSLLATERFVEDDFLLIPADLILDHNILRELVESHKEKDMIRVATSRRHLQTQRTVVLCCQKSRHDNPTILGFCHPETVKGKSESDTRIRLSNPIGAVLCPNKLFEYAHIAAGKGSKRVIDALNEYVSETGLGRCITISSQHYWFDVDTIDGMLEANSYVLRRKLMSDRSTSQFYPDRKTSVGVGWLPNRHQTQPAIIFGPVLIGDRCIIGEGSVIGPYVSIQDKCTIGRHATISNAIVLGNSRVGDSAKISSAIVRGQETIMTGKSGRDVENE
jgi:NDP-sugar pyrophosphorylase family protein